MIAEEERDNFDVFLDCLSVVIVTKLSVPSKTSGKKRGGKGRKNEIKPVAQDESNAADLSEFVEVHDSTRYHVLHLGVLTSCST